VADQVSIWKIYPLQRLISGGGQLLFDKDSSSGDAMKSITLPNEKDDAYIDNLKNQQQQGNQLYIQQTLPKDFFLSRARPNFSENIHLNHETNNMNRPYRIYG